MRIIFMGTPDFAVPPLKAIIDAGYDIISVVTNNDKPVGRKQILTPPPVKILASEYNIPVLQYNKIRVEGVDKIKELNPDLIITCAFGQILSKEILDIPRFGTINIHASLLPKYRGASPIHYAILNGEKKTGITIMKTDIGIDTGDILLQEETDILSDETCGELFERLSNIGASMIIKALKLIEDGSAKFIKQNNDDASYSKMIKKGDALLDFCDAEKTVNTIRAFNPSPIAFSYLNGEIYKFYNANIVEIPGKCGEILESDKDLIIGCGEKSISIKKIQRQGGKPLDIDVFLRGNKLKKGDHFSIC